MKIQSDLVSARTDLGGGILVCECVRACVRACLRVLGGVRGGVGDGRGFLLQVGPDGQSVVTGWESGTAGIFSI